MKKGEKKKFKINPKRLSFKEYADKEAEFKVELIDFKRSMSEIDDDFAKKFGHKTRKS